MTYSLERRLFVENGPAITAAKARNTRSTRALFLLRKQAPANDFIDAFPIAL
jgi:hypothetical protein